MPQVIFDFKDLITNCLHDKEIKFTNAIREIDSKKFISELFQNLQLVCQETELEELFKKEHFHFVQDYYIRKKIIKLVDNPYLKFDRLCQIPLSQEPRLYGNLEKIKHSNFYLFKSLILDTNHLIYNENRFAKLKSLTCLFSEDDECEGAIIQKTSKKRK